MTIEADRRNREQGPVKRTVKAAVFVTALGTAFATATFRAGRSPVASNGKILREAKAHVTAFDKLLKQHNGNIPTKALRALQERLTATHLELLDQQIESTIDAANNAGVDSALQRVKDPKLAEASKHYEGLIERVGKLIEQSQS